MRFSKFAAGAVTGFVLGLLLAPQKGRKTRKKVKQTAESWKHSLDNLFGKGETELDKLKDMLEKETDLLNPEVRAKLLKLIEENKKTIRAAKQQSLS
jgi:gas vesicle protein